MHDFKPYADIPDLCAEEVASAGDTCNMQQSDPIHSASALNLQAGNFGRDNRAYDSLAAYRAALENGLWETPPAEIIDLRLPDTRICVGAWGGGYGIYWTDYGPNDWSTWSPHLSTALCFVATIQRCGEDDWARHICVLLGEEFDAAANRFLSEVTA